MRSHSVTKASALNLPCDLQSARSHLPRQNGKFPLSTVNLQKFCSEACREHGCFAPVLSHQQKGLDTRSSPFCWCGRRELNPYGKTTRPSNVRVCQFRHSRNGFYIIHDVFAFVKPFLQNSERFFSFVF